MGTLTREELREELHANVGRRFEGEEASGLARLNRALNLAQVRIARRHDFNELRVYESFSLVPTGTLATDMVHVGMPATLRHIYSISSFKAGEGESRKLVQVPQRDWDALAGAYRTQLGEITHYSVWKQASGQYTLHWYRVPNVSYTMWRKYSLWPASLDADSQKSDLANKDDIILEFATEHIWRSLGEPELAVDRFAVGSARLEDAVKDDSKRPDMAYVGRGLSEADMGYRNYESDPFVREMP